MRGHPAYSERPKAIKDFPRNEPYVPFGVGEILRWTTDDILQLPIIGVWNISPPEWDISKKWRWVTNVQFSPDTNFADTAKMKDRLVREACKEKTVGFALFQHLNGSVSIDIYSYEPGRNDQS